MLLVQKQGLVGWVADICMVPVMYVLQGNIREVPQRTHFWNNQKLAVTDVENINPKLLITIAGNPNAVSRWFGPVPIFHMPIFGG